MQTRPRLWIVAGPNGCGKSTAYSQSDINEFDGSVWIINPDLLTMRIYDAEDFSREEANLEAVKRIESWLESSIQVHQTIGVETVLSTDKYRRLVTLAKSLGFEIRIIYVIVDTVERQNERIRLRVLKGGHHVPPEKVASRRDKSLKQLEWFFEQADYALIFDNSSAQPVVMAKLSEGVLQISSNISPEIATAIGV